MSSLTEGAVRKIVASEKAGDDPAFKPIFQVINIKQVGSPTSVRYRTVLSDGTYFVQGMLATQQNHLVETNELKQNSLIQVHDFMNNNVQARNVVILLQLTIIGHQDAKIGNPIDIEKAGAMNMANSGGGSAQPLYNRSNQQGSSGHNPYGANASPVKSNNNMGGSPGMGRNPYTPPASRFGSGGGNAPIVRNAATSPTGELCTQIAQLNMYQNRWTIKARVTNKSDIKTWSNAKGEGQLFSIDLLDSSGTDIRATMFKEAVDKFYNYLQVGNVYTFAGGKLKVANARWNTCKSQYEITFDPNAEIHLQDDGGDIQTMAFDLVKIADLERVEEGKIIDVLGVVQEIGQVQSLTSKKTGKELQKADVTIVDDTGASVRITMWGADAVNANSKFSTNQVVGFKKARVSDYGGKSLSGGSAFPEPQIPETQQLQHWWETQGSQGGVATKSLSSTGGSYGRADTFADRKPIADIKRLQLGYNNEKGDYISFKAHFAFIKKDKEGGAWYPACPNKEDPCRNRCKVIQTTDGNWECSRCNGIFPNCTRKWIFSATAYDDTAQTWVNVFNEEAETLLGGVTADEVHANYDDQNVYDSYFAKACYTEWIMKCRVKNEIVNDEPRLKTQIVRLDPVDYVQESKDILSALNDFQKN